MNRNPIFLCRDPIFLDRNNTPIDVGRVYISRKGNPVIFGNNGKGVSCYSVLTGEDVGRYFDVVPYKGNVEELLALVRELWYNEEKEPELIFGVWWRKPIILIGKEVLK